MYELVGKRVLDLALAFVGLVLTAPLQIFAAFAIWRSMGRPILFRQQRPGMGEEPFTIYKFRTMSEGDGPEGRARPDAERLTKLGSFLRETSIDELPQLWNVLRGEMSVVGPRPFLIRYLDLYSDEQRRRHEVRPGITGWTAVNGRNDQTWDEKLSADVWYRDHLSFTLDVRILLRTLAVVLMRQGVSRSGHVSGEEFLGT